MKTLTLLFLILASGVAEAAEPFGRASIEEAGGLVPGQQVHVSVDVFAPDFFVSPPQFPLFDVPGTLVTLSNERTQNLLQTIDGVQYAGIRRVYSVVPQTAGSFEMPQIAIELGYARDGQPTKTQVRVQLPAFEVVNPSVGSEQPVLAAAGLTLAQSFDRDPTGLKAGDALVRTITIAAQDTQAMLMPPVELGTAVGLAQYVKPPILNDGIELETGVGRGRSSSLGSSRTETIVYTASEPGKFQIPSVSYPWFDVDAQASTMADLPASDVVVVKADAVTERIEPDLRPQEPAARGRVRTAALWVCAIASLVAALWIGRRAAPWICGVASRQTFRMKNSRAARLRRVRTVVKVGSDGDVYQALQSWVHSLGYRSLSDWVVSEGTPQLAGQIDILERRLFKSPDVDLDRVALARLLDTRSQTRLQQKSVLPPLNPGSAV